MLSEPPFFKHSSDIYIKCPKVDFFCFAYSGFNSNSVILEIHNSDETMNSETYFHVI